MVAETICEHEFEAVFTPYEEHALILGLGAGLFPEESRYEVVSVFLVLLGLVVLAERDDFHHLVRPLDLS